MEKKLENVMIRASAGSGKTYQLSQRFLGLLEAGNPVDSILASTFTRKAAGEILSRVLRDLAKDEKHADLLQKVVKQLHRMRVSTLDSFFIQIAKNFALELKIPAGWEIVDEIDEKKLLMEAIHAVFNETDKDAVLQLMHLLFAGEIPVSLSKEIHGLALGLIGVYRETPHNAWDGFKRVAEAQIKFRLSAEDQELYISRYENVPLPKNKDGTPSKPFGKARTEDINRFQKADWDAFLSTGIAKAVVNGTNKFSSKELPDELIYTLKPFIEHAKSFVFNEIAVKTSATGELLKAIHEKFEALKLKKSALRYNDITQRLDNPLILQHLQTVVHRLDSQTKHLLLDEFQDTSPMQWHVLKPFADEAQKGNGFFCVGDVKQAIYSWRGGVSSIFESVDDAIHPEEMSLDSSWRSSQCVIDIVNKTFEEINSRDVLADFPIAAQRWRKNFGKHSTNMAELKGFCTFEEAKQLPEMDSFDDTEEGDDDNENDGENTTSGEEKKLILNYTAHRIYKIQESMPNASIGVLARSNKVIGQLIRMLRQKGIDASEEGGNPLTDSKAVQLILSVLTLADHPGNTVTRFHLLKSIENSPLAVKIGITDFRNDEQACAASLKIRQQLFDDGFGKTIQSWVDILAPFCDERELQRALQLVALAYNYQGRRGVRIDPFVEYVKNTGVKSESSARVRVMTINAAKGLEFDIVVLPELTFSLKGRTPKLVAGRESPTGPIKKVLRYIDEKKQALLPPEYKTIFEQYYAERVEESLCLLYVAMTRAVHQLTMIIPPEKETKTKKKDDDISTPSQIDGILRLVLPMSNYGDANWYDKEKKKFTAIPKAQTSEKPFSVSLASVHPEHHRNIKRISPSKLADDTRWLKPTATAHDGISPAEFGTLIHECFAQVDWLDDGVAVTPILNSEHAEKVLPLFLEMCQKPHIKNALSKTQYKSPLELYKERPFIVRKDNALLKGSIDRLVVFFDGEKPIGADIIDFKTDAVQNDEQHKEQLEAYKYAVCKMYDLPKDAVNCRLLYTFHLAAASQMLAQLPPVLLG